MRIKTIVGLLIVSAAGVAIAWLFRGGQEATAARDAVAPAESMASAHASDRRGGIVPLAAGEEFSGAAFINAAQQQQTENESAPRDAENQLAAIPEIHRAEIPRAPGPRLAADFPGPLRLLGIGPRTIESGDGMPANPSIADENAPDADESADDTIDEDESAQVIAPPALTPKKHVIQDGDTLPRLAERYLGDRGRAGEIYRLNRDRLPSAEVLPIGVEIELPREIADPVD